MANVMHKNLVKLGSASEQPSRQTHRDISRPSPGEVGEITTCIVILLLKAVSNG